MLSEPNRKKSRLWNCQPRFLLFSALPIVYHHSNASNPILLLEISIGWGWVDAASFRRAPLWRWFPTGTWGETATAVIVTGFTKGSILVWWFLHPKARNQLQSSNSWVVPSLERFLKLPTGEIINPFLNSEHQILLLKSYSHVWCFWLNF